MLDGHIHLEQGDYTLAWVDRFVERAVERNIDEIWILEHSYRFSEFAPMYESVRGYSEYNRRWLRQKAGVADLGRYLALIREARERGFPIRVKFGLEVCYFPGCESLVAEAARGRGFDFLVGSVHFVDGFAFDHAPELWDGVDVDQIYERYFEISGELARAGLFDGIAHPDCVKLFGHRASHPLDSAYNTLAGLLARAGMYAEQSSGIYRRCPGAQLGMDKGMIRCMQKHRVELHTVSDAHRPQDVGAQIPELTRLLEAAGE